MKLVIQRVSHAGVTVEGKSVASIGKGFMVLIGVCDSDTQETADKLLKKMLNLRIFEDADGKTNLALKDVNGQLLLVSQFTLYADCKKGNRPSFVKAGSPEHANAIYEYMVAKCKETCEVVQTGIFGAHMKVTLENDGPFTIILDSAEL